jgi:hypothetical protein
MWLDSATSAARQGSLLALFPDHFWDGFGGAVIGAVLGAIVGGLLASFGGYVATRRIRQLDIQRAADQSERDYRAAVLVVSDELNANRGVAMHLMVEFRSCG